MKTDIKTLQDLVKISYEAYEDSIREADTIIDMFHNRQYTEAELAVLANRGQPAETFNIIKMFGRLLLGYYSTVVNTVKVFPKQESDVVIASLLNDTVDFTMRDNQFETEGDKIKLDGLLAGVMCCYVDVEDTDEMDEFGRTIRRISLTHVPANEILLDPLSKLEDYSDGRYIHRYKWVSDDMLKTMFKGKTKEIERLEAYHNHLNIDQAEFEDSFSVQFEGYFKRYDNYLLVHSIVKDDNGKAWSIYWCGDEELSRKEITYKEVKFPYRVHKIHTSNKTEFYGIFREVYQSQRAINQAILKIQLMVNTQKAFVEERAVEDIAKFTDQFNRINAIIPVKSLKGIKIENLTREVIDQYTVIDKALDRIKMVLGVNDSFLGMAFASDSGRKVKLQQNATALALRYISVRIEQFYRLLGWDIVNLIKQYYIATQVLRVADERVGQRWVTLNKPLMNFTGQFDQQGQPIMDYVWEEVLNPEDGKPMINKDGNYVIAPIPEADTEVAFAAVDLDIDSVIYNDDDEKNQLMLETFIQGPLGQVLMQYNPGGFMKIASLAVRSIKTKYSLDISEILEETAMQLAGGGQEIPPELLDSIGQAKKSSSLKLPQNTNEGA